VNFKATIALVMLLAICLAVVWLVGSEQPGTGLSITPTPQSADRRLVEPEPEKATKLALARPDHDLVVFEQIKKPDSEDTEWRLVEPIEAKVKSWEVTSLVDAFKDLKYQAEFVPGQRGAVSLETAGLDKPRATVEFYYKDKEDNDRQVSILVGKRVPLTEDTYVKLREGEKIYVAKADLNDKLKKELDDYRDTDLLDFEKDKVVRAEFVSPAQTIVAIKSKDEWVLDSPVKARAEKEKLEKIFDKLRWLRASTFVEDQPKDLKIYGLDAPELKVSLNLEEKVASKDQGKDEEKEAKEKDEGPKEEVRKWNLGIAFGSFSNLDKSKLYVKLTDQPWVAEVDKSGYDDIKPDLQELRDKRVVQGDAGKATRIELTTRQQHVVLVKEPNWKMIQPIEAKADGSAVLDFINGLKDLKAKQFEEPGAERDFGFNEPRLTVSLTIEGQVEPERLTIGKESGSGLSAFVRRDNSGSIGVVNSRDLKPVLVGPLSFRARDIFSFDRKAATQIRIVRTEGQSFELRKEEDSWGLVQPVEAPPERGAVKQLLADMHNLRAQAYVAKGNLGEYGLDSPQVKVAVTVTVTPKPQESATKPATRTASGPSTQVSSRPATSPAPMTYQLWVSRDPKKDNRVFARLPNNQFVFEISQAKYDHFTAEMHVRQVLELDVLETTALSIVSTGKKDRVFNKKDDNWTLKGDPYFTVNNKKVKKSLEKLKDLKAVRFVVYRKAKLAEYGLDEPARTIEVRSGSTKPAKLLISSTQQDGNFFASVVGDDRVFLLEPADLEGIDKPLIEFAKQEGETGS